jgi:hypothetical protein
LLDTTVVAPRIAACSGSGFKTSHQTIPQLVRTVTLGLESLERLANDCRTNQNVPLHRDTSRQILLRSCPLQVFLTRKSRYLRDALSNCYNSILPVAETLIEIAISHLPDDLVRRLSRTQQLEHTIPVV